MRKVKLIFFKPSGKYYTSEDEEFPLSMPVYNIIDSIERTCEIYKGMHIVLQFDTDDNIGFPCLILAENRKVGK